MRILTSEHGDEIPVLIDGDAGAEATLIFAHGAGAAMDSDFMETMARGVAAHGHACIRFEFPYMARRRDDGRRRPPDRPPRLLAAYAAVVEMARAENNPGTRLYAGGKSMGGRMATLLASDPAYANKLDGLVVAGYPFHPPGKPDRLRTEHFPDLHRPVLICQGERDPFGTREEVEAMPLPATFTIAWLPDGDHDLRPRRKSGLSHAENLSGAILTACRFMNGETDSQS